MKTSLHQRRSERVVDLQAKVDQLIRLDRAEDAIVARATEEARAAELHAGRAEDLLAAAKRVDAAEDELIGELRMESHAIAGDVTSMTSELIGAARARADAPRLEAAK